MYCFYTQYLQKQILRSWNDASTICRSVEGQLPLFRSKEEMNELMSLIKFSLYTPGLKAIFIGLVKYIEVSFRNLAKLYHKHKSYNRPNANLMRPGCLRSKVNWRSIEITLGILIV